MAIKRTSLVALCCAIAVVIGLIGFTHATAQQPGATRSINPSSVPASGGTVTVTVDIVGSYGIGSVVETLPPADGFQYVSGSVMPSDITATESGREVTFSLVGESSFTYDVTVPASPGEHTFDGALTYGVDKTVAQIGETTVTVEEAAAATVSATRSIRPSSVPASGGRVTVTVDIVGSYGIGSVVETLPPAGGFRYVSGSVVPSDITPTESGRKVTFPLVGETSFTYDVTVPASPGKHTFDGALTYGVDRTVAQIGETTVTVEEAAAATVSATRSIRPGSVPASGGTVTVTVNIVGSYGIGSVVETLPPADGFQYVSGSVMPSDITPTESGREVSFPLVGESSFTYDVTVTASPGRHPFSGALTYGVDKTVAQIGETTVTVEEAAPATVSATRSIRPGSVPASGGTVTVTVNIVGSYGIGSVVETLPPAGFEYVSVTPSDITTTVSGREVRFSLVGESSFTYKVTAPAASPGEKHTFDGALTYGIDKDVAQIGKTTVTVRAATPPTKTPKPTTSTTGGSGSSGSGSGSGGGSAPAAATPTPTPTATATPSPTAVPTTPPVTLVPTAVPDTPMPTAPVAIPVGPPGEEGEQGEPGTIGDPGPKGEPGAIGDPGPKGKPGAIGDTGPKGATGSAGPKGATGSAGETGAKGGVGPAGEAGAMGESGSGILGIVALILGIVAIVGVGGAFLLRRN